MVRKKRQINPYLLLILAFLGFVLIGSLLLSMPFAFNNNPNNEWCHVGSYLDAFFTSLAAMTLTGVTTYPEGLANTLSLSGQIIVLVLVQIGGLGIVTFLTFFFILLRRRLQFKDRLLISQAIAFNNYAEINKYVIRLIIITAICETVGIGLGVPVFATMFPNEPLKIIYYSTFHSISAFNNAGFDLFQGTSSMMNGLDIAGCVVISTTHWLYYYCTIYLAVLSLLGGISFLVIIDIFIGHKSPRRWSSYTKICLTMTAAIIMVMTSLLFLTEGIKEEKPMHIFEALLTILNCRTAGFSVYPIEDISVPGKMICGVVMLIGGSPLSTAGGIKITTIFIIVLSIISYFRGKVLAPFKRVYSYNMIAKSMSLVYAVVLFLLLAFFGLVGFGAKDTATLSAGIKDNLVGMYLFEVLSCFSNVGFQTGLEAHLSVGSRIILCLLMLVGHVGPMTFFQLFQNNLDKKATMHYSFVEEDILIG
ncbi:MAG: hypothetical protein IJR08_00515 [Bacilli bacterium]|nr:hypothetical protein [Bacilli bacterium]